MDLNDKTKYNPFHSFSPEMQNQNGFCNNLQNPFLTRSINAENRFQNEIYRYDRKISLPDNTYNYRGHSHYHFEFSGDINLSPEKKQISEKKAKHYDLDNISIIRRKIESNSPYVAFENKGENSCFLNVILHFLYFFPCINEYLIKLYQVNKDNIIFSNNDNFDFFLFLLGKTLHEYQKALSNSEKKEITILHTTELRKYLEDISNNFKFNKVADPVELLAFLLNLINKNNQKEIHKYFYLNLIEEIYCSKCHHKIHTEYDKDNFIYHIYVDEILNYINNNNMKYEVYNSNLFPFSKFISSISLKNCEECRIQMNKAIKCEGPEYPTFLIINCIWNNPKPSLKDIIKFLYIIPLEHILENLFFCINNNKKKPGELYDLFGMILYSPGLSHYINVMFNIEKNIFVLYDDDKVKELASIHDVYKYITVRQIKKSPNFYFYPVLLIYYKEIIYDDQETIYNNQYSIKKYNLLVEEYKKIQNESQKSLTAEEKKKNMYDLINAQMRYEQNNYFNNDEYENLGRSSLYKVNEEKDEEKFNSSNKLIKMQIDEDSKDKTDINAFSKNEKGNTNNLYKDINNQNHINNNNNMFIETQELNNNINKMNLDGYKLGNKEYNNNIFTNSDSNFNKGIKNNHPSVKNITNGLFLGNGSKGNNGNNWNNNEFRRNNLKHKTYSKSTKKDFFSNII